MNDYKKIPGLRVGVKIRDGHVYSGGVFDYVAVAPDNVYNNLDLTKVPLPAGYEYSGVAPSDDVEEGKWWFRRPNYGEIFIARIGGTLGLDLQPLVLAKGTDGPDHRRIILKKTPPKTKTVLIVECEDSPGVASSVFTKTKYPFNVYQANIISTRREERPI